MLSIDSSFPFDLNGGKSLFISKNSNTNNSVSHNSNSSNGIKLAGSNHSNAARSSGYGYNNAKVITDPSPLQSTGSNDGGSLNLNNTGSNELLMKYRNSTRLLRQTPSKIRLETTNIDNTQSQQLHNGHIPYTGTLPKLNRNTSGKINLNMTSGGSNLAEGIMPSQMLPKLDGTTMKSQHPNGVVAEPLEQSVNNILNPSRSRQQYIMSNIQNSRDREREREKRRQSRQQGLTTTNSSIPFETAMNGMRITSSEGSGGNHNNTGAFGVTTSHGNHKEFRGKPAPPLGEPSPAMTQEISANSAVTSFKGLKPGRPDWINQDNYFLVKTSHGSEMYCVLDGHGEHGHLVSRKCRADMPSHIVSCNFDLKRAFATTQQNLLESKDMDAGCSGATCVLAILSHHSLTLAHAGDSRAVMGKRTAVGGYSAVVLTQDHKPDRPDEKKRILACGGHVGSRQVMIDTMGGRVPSNVTTGPCRVWYKNGSDTMGLAMSRSLGDGIVHTCGVSAEPEILQTTLDPSGKDEFLILATDGLWDVIDSTQAVRIVGSLILRTQQQAEHNAVANHGQTGFSSGIIDWNPKEASEHLCSLARKRWESVSAMIDDITCMVVKLPSQAQLLSENTTTTSVHTRDSPGQGLANIDHNKRQSASTSNLLPTMF